MDLRPVNSVRNRDEVYIEDPSLFKIKFYTEFNSWRKNLISILGILLMLLPFAPLPFLSKQQANDYKYTALVLFFIAFLIAITILLYFSLRYSFIDLVIFDLKNQTIGKGRYRPNPLFKKEIIDETFSFSAVKSIETNKEESELTIGPPFHHLNIQMTFYTSDIILTLLHLPHKGIVQSLSYGDWLKFFQTIIKSQPDTTTSDITKDFKIESVKMSYFTDQSIFSYN